MAQPAKPNPQAQVEAPAKPAVTADLLPPEMAELSETKLPAASSSPAATSPQLRPEDFAKLNEVPPPAPFSGMDGKADDPIPPEVQRVLDSGTSRGVTELVALLTYAHPKVRYHAVRSLCYPEEADRAATAQALRGALRDPDMEVRREACNSLRDLKEAARPALPDLITTLDDRETYVRRRAADAIAAIGPSVEPAIPWLAERLARDDDSNIRGALATALGNCGPAAKSTVPLLVKCFDSSNSRDYAAVALAKVGAQEELLTAATSSDPFVRTGGAIGLAALPEKTPAMVQLLNKLALQDKVEDCRVYAAEGLGTVRPTTAEIVATLCTAAKDPEWTVRRSAYTALGATEPKFDVAIPILVAGTNDPEKSNWDAAKRALGTYQNAAEFRLQAIVQGILKAENLSYSGDGEALVAGAAEFFPALLALAKNPQGDEAQRGVALMAMRFILDRQETPDEKWKTELLTQARQLLRTPAEPVTVRAAAALVLRKFREQDPLLIPTFLAGINQAKFLDIQTDCLYAMDNLDGPQWIATLTTAAQDPRERLSESAIYKLKDQRAKADSAQPVMLKLAQDRQSKVRLDALEALGAIGTQPQLCLPLLRATLSDEDEYARTKALHSLGQVLVQNKLDVAADLPAALELLNKEKGYNKTQILESLTAFGPAAAPLLEQVTPLLNDKQYAHAAAKLLGAMGPAAKSAAPAIAELAATSEYPSEAISAIAKIKLNTARFAEVAPKLLDQLKLRSEVLHALAAMGDQATAAVPAIAKILASPDEWERGRAVTTLGEIGPAAKAALPDLLKLAAEDPEENLRRRAVDALQKIAPADPVVLELSLAGLGQMGEREQEEMLQRLGTGAGDVIARGLQSPNLAVRQASLKLLPRVKSPTACIPLYQQALKDAAPQVAATAALELLQLGQSSPAEIKILIAALNGSDDWEIRSGLQLAGRQALPLLVDALLDEKNSLATRRSIADSLTSLNASPPALLAKLRTALKSDQPHARHFAAITLAALDRESRQADAVLLASLQGEDSSLKTDAINALPRLVFEAPATVPDPLADELMKLVRSDDRQLAQSATYALAQLPLSEKQLPAVLALFETEALRGSAVTLLGYRKPVSAKLVAPLARALKQGDEDLAGGAAQALHRQGAEGRAALVACLTDATAPAAARIESALALQRPVQTDPQLRAKLAALLSDETVGPATAVLLGDWGYEWKPLEPHILQALTSNNYRLVSPAMECLRDRQSDAQSLIPALLKLVADPQQPAWSNALQALGHIGEPAPAVLAELTKQLQTTSDENIARQLANALNNLGHQEKVAEVLVAALEHAEGPAQLQLIRTLRRTAYHDRQSPVVAAQLRKFLAVEDPALQREAALTLPLFDRKAADAVPALIAALGDESTRRDALVGLQRLGPQAAPAVEALLPLLDGNDFDMVAHTLAQIGSAAAPAIPKLLELLPRQDRGYSAMAVFAAIGKPAAPAIPALMALLSNEHQMVRATHTLRKLETPPAQLLTPLVAQLKDPNLATASAHALAQLGPDAKTAAPPLILALQQTGDPELAVTAAYALGQLKDNTASSALLVATANPNRELKVAALHALGGAGLLPEKAVPVLIKLVSDKDVNIQRAALYGLAGFKTAAAPALNVVVAALDQPQLAEAAIQTLGAIGPAAKVAVPRLVKFTTQLPGPDEEDRDLRFSAIRALGDLGPAAAAALPTLLQLHSEKVQPFRTVLEESIWKIDPTAAKNAGIEAPPKAEDE